MYVEEVIC